MKHLLIILSILLLSSPVIGDNHKGETLYRWDNPSGDGYVWKGFGDKETHPVYKGDVKNGKPNGVGEMTYPDGGEYVGEWKDGKKHGQGTDKPFWGVYVGEWKDGKYNGLGTQTFDDGGKYVGEWKDGKKHGQGIYTKSWNEEKYVGEFKDSKEWNGINYYKIGTIEFPYGEIKYKVVNGKKIKQ